MLHVAAVVGQLPLLSLVHVVGPLRAVASASSFTVNEPAPASREGAPASSAVVHPGLLSVAVVVLKDEQELMCRVRFRMKVSEGTLTHQVVLPALGGVLRVPLLLWGAHLRVHVSWVSVAVVSLIIAPVPPSASHSGKLQKRGKRID